MPGDPVGAYRLYGRKDLAAISSTAQRADTPRAQPP
jgi:hypothetical protein